MSRIRSLDLARGFTVLFIPAIHTGMLYSDLSVHESILGKFLIFIAEGPGGQLLMLLMGVSFALKPKQDWNAVLSRSITLLLVGYLLNILKFIWPYEFGWLPQPILQELGIINDKPISFQLLLIGDILHFSAIATIVLYVIQKQKNYPRLAAITALIIVIISPLIWKIKPPNPILNYLVSLFNGEPPHVFFPVFPWLVYPLTGLALAHYLRIDQKKTSLVAGILGTALIVVGGLADLHNPVENLAGFYRTPAAATSWHMGIVLLALSLWSGISKWAKDNLIFDLLIYSSKNITAIYFIQWVMICWMLPIAGFRQLNLFYSIIMMVIMTANTYALTFIYQHLKPKYGNK